MSVTSRSSWLSALTWEEIAEVAGSSVLVVPVGSTEQHRTARAEPGDTRPLAELMPVLREAGVRAVSGNGVLGQS